MRDHRNLEVFGVADELAIEIYRQTRAFPASERYGLRSQLRRSAASVPVNIVEGCGRNSDAELDRFLEIALGSARELLYLISLANRLGHFTEESAESLLDSSDHVCRLLVRLVKAREDFRT